LFPWSSNTTIHNFGLDLNIMWNIIKFAFLLNHMHFSFHNPQVYAINSIFCSTLSKLVRSLMVLSFNSPKPTKWLDALTIFSFLVIDDNTIKAYNRLINSKILNPMIYWAPPKCVHRMEFQILASNTKCSYSRWSVGTLLYLSIRGVQDVIMINMMLMAVHALKKFLKLSCAALPRVSAALPHSGC
jgi:hypothetical protein